jgi:hypothetical protein
MRIRFPAAVLVVLAALAAAVPALAVTAPFTWQSHTWCPNLRGTLGFPASCSAAQDGFAAGDASFDPAQVSVDGSGNVNLAMNAAGTVSGAFNTGGQETFSASSAGNSVSERIKLPCTGTPARIDNWPAFWLATTGSWPAGGEIDVMEGLHGVPEWHYHYLNKQGVHASVGGTYPNTTGCGTAVTYEVIWYSSGTPRVTFYAAGTLEAIVAGSCAGLPSPCFATDGTPVATGPMYLLNDYENDNGTESGPLVDGVSMQVQAMTGTHN